MYLVTGGTAFQVVNDNNNIIYRDSTEIMVEEKSGWEVIEKHPLPHPLKDLRGVSIENKIFMIGKIF